jgi:cytosine/creatinine deaminase
MHDILIKNVRPWGHGEPCDLAIDGGRFVEAEKHNRAHTTLDARGAMAIPSFVEPHIHLDKALINRDVRQNLTGTLSEAIEIIWERKRNYTNEDIVTRASEVIDLAVQNGITRLRSHADVDMIGGLKPLQGLISARDRYKGLIDIQIVAFPQEGILKNPGTEQLLEKALELGADAIGGMPFNENSPMDSWRHIEIAFALARKFNVPVDMHVDETDDPGARTLEMLADQTITNGWQGRVNAGHTCALAAYPHGYAATVIRKVKEADINMITLPVTNLVLQGRLDVEPRRRGITRVKELLQAGVNVTFGQDCVRDTFYPFGRADLLEVAAITAHAAQMTLPHEIETVFDMCTRNAARACNLANYDLTPGTAADVVVLDARTPTEAIVMHADCLFVIKGGRLLAETRTARTRHWNAGPAELTPAHA